MAQSNLAYKYDDLAKFHKQNEILREERKKEVTKAKAREQRRLNFYIVCAILALSFSAYFMVSKNVQVHETSKKIENLQKELTMLESNTSQKIFELEQSVDLNTVEEIASTRLNMQRPEKYQIVYLNVPVEDVTEITANDVEGVKNQVGNMAEKFKKNFFGIFDMGLK